MSRQPFPLHRRQAAGNPTDKAAAARSHLYGIVYDDHQPSNNRLPSTTYLKTRLFEDMCILGNACRVLNRMIHSCWDKTRPRPHFENAIRKLEALERTLDIYGLVPHDMAI